MPKQTVGQIVGQAEGGRGRSPRRNATLTANGASSCSPSSPSTVAAAADLPCIPHADALHHRARADVVTDRAGHHGLHAEHVEGKVESRASDLGRVAESPELGAQRPADLEPVRVRRERPVDLVRHSHPRLGREQRVDLTPVVVDRSPRQPPATDDLAARAVVRDPFVDAVEPPRVAHELRPAARPPRSSASSRRTRGPPRRRCARATGHARCAGPAGSSRRRAVNRKFGSGDSDADSCVIYSPSRGATGTTSCGPTRVAVSKPARERSCVGRPYSAARFERL